MPDKSLRNHSPLADKSLQNHSPLADKSLQNHSPWQTNHCEIIPPGRQIIVKSFYMAGKSL
jgi:hypothetical protein